MIRFDNHGNFSKTYTFFHKALMANKLNKLDKYGEEGVIALSKNTPVDSGKTAGSWSYKIEYSNSGATISWYNKNIVDGVPIAIVLQYGHATQNGGFVQGRDYINPAIQPIFDKLAQLGWEEMNRI